MSPGQRRDANRYQGGPAPSTLADAMDTVLDKGLLVEGFERLSVAGLELLSLDGVRGMRRLE